MPNADAAVAEAAEGKAGAGHVDNVVVDGHTAGLQTGGDGGDVATRFAVDVEGKRCGAGFDGLHDGFDVVVDQNRKHRPEDFLLENLGTRGHVEQDGWGDVALVGANLAPDEGPGTAGEGVINQTTDALGVPLVDDALVIGRGRRVCAVFAGDGRLKCREEGIALGGVNENVVRGDADLAGVEEFGPHQAASGNSRICCLVHDDRGFPAEFEGDAARMRGGGGHHLLADGGRAGEVDVVEGEPEEVLGDLNAALNAEDFFWREDGLDNLGANGRNVRGELGGLQEGWAACGDGRHERTEKELQRVVPGCNDQGHALGLRANPRRRTHHGQSPRHLFLPHPPPQPTPNGLEFRLEHIDFRQVHLLRWFLEIRMHGRLDVRSALQHFSVQAFEPPDSGLGRQRALGGSSCLQAVERCGELSDRTRIGGGGNGHGHEE